MPKVWFIRHGESISNANLPTAHPAESELTPQGHSEARAVVQAIPHAPNLIVMSPYLRARQTAVPTIERFPETAVATWPVHEFTYLHPERYNGTRGTERGPWAAAYWERSDPQEEEMGGGESFASLLQRVAAMNGRLQQQPHDFIVVFSHGLFLRAFLWTWLMGTPQPTTQAMRRFQSFLRAVKLPNTAIIKTAYDATGNIHLHGVIAPDGR